MKKIEISIPDKDYDLLTRIAKADKRRLSDMHYLFIVIYFSNFGFDDLSGFSGKWNIARKFVSYAKSTNSFSIEIAKGQPKLSIVRIFDFNSILCFDFEYRQIPTTESKSADRTSCALLK